MNALVTQVQDSIPVVGQFAIKRSLRCVTSSCCCIGRGYTHIQGRAASWDSSEEICRPVLRCCEPSGFGRNAWVCKFLSTQEARTQAWCPRVASAVLQVSPCSSCGSRKEPHNRH